MAMARDLAVQPDGKFIVAGSSQNGVDTDFALARYTSGGALDTSFGVGGAAILNFGTESHDEASSVALQADGKIVVAGHSNYLWSANFTLVRYTSAGVLDASFGSGGKVITPIGTSEAYVSSVAIQSDGKIIAAGIYADDPNNFDIALVRYTTTGALDTSFGTGGKVTTAIGISDDYVSRFVVTSDGKIVVAATTRNGTDTDSVLIRYTSAGVLDSSFGSGGKVITAVQASDDGFIDLVVQPDEKIFAVGYTNSDDGSGFAFARYTSAGVLDATFGNGGMVTANFGTGDQFLGDIAFQADGKIVVTGQFETNFALARYTSAGTLDASFGIGGKVFKDFVDSDDSGNSIAVQADGKIVVAGDSLTYNYTTDSSEGRFLLARFLDGDSAGPTSGFPQSIVFPSIPNQSLENPEVQLDASTDSGLPIKYTVISGPATLNGSTLNFTGTGIVVIRASQAGDGTYAPAAIQQQAFVVTENAVESSGDLSIGLSQPVIRLYNSVRTSTKIRAIRDGWDGPVHLHYSGLPHDVTGSLGFADPSSGYLNAGQSEATLSLIVGSTAPPGHWPITINASAGGHTATNTLVLIIKAPKYRAPADISYTNFWDGHPDGRTVWNMSTDYTVEVDYTVSPAMLRISGRRIGTTSGPANPSDMNISVSGKITTPYPQIDVTIDIGTTNAKETARLQGYVSGSSLILHMSVAYIRDQGGGGTLVPWMIVGNRVHGAEISAKSSRPGSGSIICSPLPPTNGYAKGTVVTLTAEPNPGAVFKGWSEDVTGTTNPIQVTITEDGYPDKQVTATFAEPGGKPPLISSSLNVSGNTNIGQAYQFKTSREVKSLTAIGLPQGLYLSSTKRILGSTTEVGDFNVLLRIQTEEGVSYQVMALSIYPPLATGTYYGLVNADTIAHETSGSLKVTVAKTGAFSAAIMFGGKSYSLRGKFTPDGSFTGGIPRKLLNPLAVDLELDSQTGQISGTIEGDAGPATLAAERAVYHAKTNPAPQAGKYTIVSFPMEASSEENPIPQGNGAGTIVVDKAGNLRMVKTLADGTKITHASSLSAQDSWPFYVALNKSAGSISGMMSMADDAVSDANGIMHWFKPSVPLAAFYPESFGTTYEFVASRYVAPIKGTRVLPYADATNNAVVTIDGGNLVFSPVPKLVTLAATNKVIPPTGEAFSLSFSLSTGLFSGKFLDPATNKARTFTGAVLQKAEKGYGLFKGNGEYGWIELEAAE